MKSLLNLTKTQQNNSDRSPEERMYICLHLRIVRLIEHCCFEMCSLFHNLESKCLIRAELKPLEVFDLEKLALELDIKKLCHLLCARYYLLLESCLALDQLLGLHGQVFNRWPIKHEENRIDHTIIARVWDDHLENLIFKRPCTFLPCLMVRHLGRLLAPHNSSFKVIELRQQNVVNHLSLN